VRTRVRLLAALIATIWFCPGSQVSASPAPRQSPSPQGATKSGQVPPPEARIDINHASVAELLKVPGMTPSWAGRIVRFRPYRTKQDLLDRGVLPSDVYDRIKDYVIAHREKQ
jgi:DNA uptake protein ComE-like DNA-binding protein